MSEESKIKIECWLANEKAIELTEDELLQKANGVIRELERMRAQIEYQDRPVDEITEQSGEAGDEIKTKRNRIINFLWKLYEKTLKVVVDSVLEKLWSK